jgi:hypothetical protein
MSYKILGWFPPIGMAESPVGLVDTLEAVPTEEVALGLEQIGWQKW